MLKGPVATATLRTSVVLLLRLVLQAGTLLLVARALGPYSFGAYVGIAALAMLLGSLTTFGTHLVLLAEASRAYRRRLRVLPYCVTTSLLAGSMLLLVYLLVSGIVFRDLPVSVTLVTVIGVTELILQPLLALPSAQLQAQRKIVASQIVHLVPLALRFLVIGYISLKPVADPLQIFVIGSLVAGLIGLAAATWMAERPWPAFHHWRIATMSELRGAVGFAALTITARGPTEIDKSLAARLLPLATAGLYSGAARIISAVNVPVQAMIQSALPTLFAQAREAAGIRPKMLATMFGAAFIYGSGAAFAMWLVVPAIVWLFGDSYAGIGQAAGLLCLAIPGTTVRMTSGAVLIARHQPWSRVLYEASGVVAIIAASILLAPKFGIVGMIGAYVVAEWMMAIFAASLVIRHRHRAVTS